MSIPGGKLHWYVHVEAEKLTGSNKRSWESKATVNDLDGDAFDEATSALEDDYSKMLEGLTGYSASDGPPKNNRRQSKLQSLTL